MDQNLDPAYPDIALNPNPSQSWHEGWRRRLGARRVSDGPPEMLRRPSDFLLNSGLPGMMQGGLGVPQPFRANWTNMMIGPLSPATGGGGSGSGTVEQVIGGTAISVSPGSSGAATYTVTGAYTPGALISITADEIACTLTAGSNLSFTGDQLNAANQYPSAGYAIDVSGSQVNWASRIMPCLLLLNAVRDTTTDALTTGEEPLNLATALNWHYVYKAVPVKITSLSLNSGTGVVTLSVAVDTDDAFKPSVYSNGAYVEAFNVPTYSNSSGFVYAGVNQGSANYPAGYSPRGIGEMLDDGGGDSTWFSPLVQGFRYEISTGVYRWGMCIEPDHDGSCSAPDSAFSTLAETLTSAEY